MSYKFWPQNSRMLWVGLPIGVYHTQFSLAYFLVSTPLSKIFDVGDRDLPVLTSGNWVIKGWVIKWPVKLRTFLKRFLLVFQNPKNDFLHFLSGWPRFLEHWLQIQSIKYISVAVRYTVQVLTQVTKEAWNTAVHVTIYCICQAFPFILSSIPFFLSSFLPLLPYPLFSPFHWPAAWGRKGGSAAEVAALLQPPWIRHCTQRILGEICSALLQPVTTEKRNIRQPPSR